MTRCRKSIAVVLALVFVLMFNIPTASANQAVTVRLDGELLSFDVQPQILNGRTMVPMRKIFEALGAVVTWDGASQTATGRKGDTTVNITINSKTLFKNGVPKILDVPPALIGGRTLVPVRAIAESFDCKVDWIQATRTVKITTNGIVEKTAMSASEISEKVAQSVFYIEVCDKNYKFLGSGSGFFISSDGTAVTNYHVIEDSYGAKIMTTAGDIFDVTGVIGFDKDLDVAIIKISKTSASGKTVSGFPAVEIADSDNIKAGQKVFAIGSPQGLQNTISDGIISNIDRGQLIQITAPISHGSSGGALVNEYGEVLGITSSGIDSAQNIGFAIPINVIKSFDLNARVTPYTTFAVNNSDVNLEVYPQSVEVEVGESVTVLVYAEGVQDDQTIYWKTKENALVSCEWGDWIAGDTPACPLTITGLSEGVETVTVFLDSDYKELDITVHIKRKTLQTYPSSCTAVPTYTSVTGEPLLDYRDQYSGSIIYIYDYDIDNAEYYMTYLQNIGYVFYGEEDGAFYFITPQNKIISVVLAYKWNQIWILIPR